MAYQKPIDRLHPSFVMLLLDQSWSMSEPLPDRPGKSKAHGVADTVNELLYTLVLQCVREGEASLRHYYDIGIIGYGDNQVRSMFPGDLAGRKLVSVQEIADAQIRLEERDGGSTPVWFDPVAQGGTPMCAALDLASQIADGWLRNHSDSFPPIVINITDGQPTDGDPTEPIGRLRSLHNKDGNLLLLNVIMSSAGSGNAVVFPSSEDALPDDYAKHMFRLSSLLPELMRERAGMIGRPTAQGARGFACNAGISHLAEFLEVGTHNRFGE